MIDSAYQLVIINKERVIVEHMLLKTIRLMSWKLQHERRISGRRVLQRAGRCRYFLNLVKAFNSTRIILASLRSEVRSILILYLFRGQSKIEQALE